VILPVFKTGGRPSRATVCSTHTRFRQLTARLSLRFPGITTWEEAEHRIISRGLTQRIHQKMGSLSSSEESAHPRGKANVHLTLLNRTPERSHRGRRQNARGPLPA